MYDATETESGFARCPKTANNFGPVFQKASTVRRALRDNLQDWMNMSPRSMFMGGREPPVGFF